MKEVILSGACQEFLCGSQQWVSVVCVFWRGRGVVALLESVVESVIVRISVADEGGCAFGITWDLRSR